MPAKPKAPEEKIVVLAKTGLSNSQIAKELGIKYAGSFNDRCQRIRRENGIPEWNGKMGRPFGSKDSVKRQIKSDKPKKEGFPFEAAEIVIFSGRLHTVSRMDDDKIILRENATQKPVTITLDEYTKNPGIIRKIDEKAPIKTAGEDIILKRRRNDEEPNPLDRIETEIETLYRRGADEFEEVIESAASGEQPFRIDLEMDDITDPVALKFEPQDYVDDEWFDRPLPRKGTVERTILDKALHEIGEIQTLRTTLQTALSIGDRLPATEVDRYNKYVSKYQGVGA